MVKRETEPAAGASEASERGPATVLALRHLKTLKGEHQVLLAQMMEDRGMAASTLETLVEHLLEEEDPALSRALERVKSGASSEAVSGAFELRNGTLGDLRRRPVPTDTSIPKASGPRFTVGELRQKR